MDSLIHLISRASRLLLDKTRLEYNHPMIHLLVHVNRRILKGKKMIYGAALFGSVTAEREEPELIIRERCPFSDKRLFSLVLASRENTNECAKNTQACFFSPNQAKSRRSLKEWRNGFRRGTDLMKNLWSFKQLVKNSLLRLGWIITYVIV